MGSITIAGAFLILLGLWSFRDGDWKGGLLWIIAAICLIGLLTIVESKP